MQSYLLLGGNIGDTTLNIFLAKQAIGKKVGKIISQSSIYETEAWGNQAQPTFLNQVIEIETKFSAESLLEKLLEIEQSQGRIRTEKYSPRTIDLDILFYGNQIIETPYLKVPHPRIGERRFVLVPMSEISPNFLHPILQKTVQELLQICPDTLNVKKFLPK